MTIQINRTSLAHDLPPSPTGDGVVHPAFAAMLTPQTARQPTPLHTEQVAGKPNRVASHAGGNQNASGSDYNGERCWVHINDLHPELTKKGLILHQSIDAHAVSPGRPVRFDFTSSVKVDARWRILELPITTIKKGNFQEQNHTVGPIVNTGRPYPATVTSSGQVNGYYLNGEPFCSSAYSIQTQTLTVPNPKPPKR